MATETANEHNSDAEASTDSFQVNVYIVGVRDSESGAWERDAFMAHSDENAKHQARHNFNGEDPQVYHCREVASDV